jgi:phosphatidate cytidylyltransferase
MKNNKEIIQPNELTQETKASMKTRIISAIIALVVAVPTILVGDIFFFIGAVFILLVSTYEIIHCAKKKYNPALYITAFILAVLMTFWPAIRSIPDFVNGTKEFNWHIYPMFGEIYISLPVLALGIFGLFVLVLIDKGFTVRDACFIFTMMLTITIGYQSALVVRYLPSQAHAAIHGSTSSFNLYDNLESALLIIYILIATFMSDVGAYFIGVFFGKHKLNPRISPKKTWEGFFGGIIISTIVSFAFGFIFSICGHPLVYGILDREHWYLILVLSLVIPFASVLGDFVFSSAKRHFEIKDFGNIMPGHGGVLDRLDSVIFSMLATGAFITLYQYWSKFVAH